MSQDTGKVGMVGETPTVLTAASHVVAPRRAGISGVLPRRGGRKKTLSLNPEEREALENLIEEVIIDGGMGDSESASSDEEENSRDQGKEKLDASTSLTAPETINDSKAVAAFKMSKKFYPGQLKVALKHMSDLPPRFSRKLKKAEKYLEMSSAQKKTSVSTSIKEEEEEEVLSFNNSNPTSIQDCKASPVSPKQFQNDKVKAPKEKTQKDLKKTIRSLLTDLDQYVDEKDRTSISLDLPGAVSCADLERETLGYPVKSPESGGLPAPSPQIEASSSKVETHVSSTAFESANLEKQKNNGISAKPASHNINQFNQPSTPKNFAASVPSSSIYMSSLPPRSGASKMSTVDNAKLPILADNSAFQQYSNLNQSNFIDGSSILMPVQPILPQMPQIDFTVPPPTTFQYPAQYGMTSPQENFIQNKVQFQPQFGFLELPAAAPAPTHTGTNFVGTTPIIFQQYNTMPIVSQTQQVQSIPYANSSSYFVGRFNCSARPLNYMKQFQTPPPHMNADTLSKTGMDRLNATQRKQGMNNSSSGNFRTYRAKPNASHQPGSEKTEGTNSKNRPRNVRQDSPYYIKHEAAKGKALCREATSQRTFVTMSEMQTRPPNLSPLQGIQQAPIVVLSETLQVPGTIFYPAPDVMPTQSSSISSSIVDGDFLTESGGPGMKSVLVDSAKIESSPDDFTPEQSASGEPSKLSCESKCDSTTTLDEFLADIDIGTIRNETCDGKTGLDVVLGEQFVRKLNELFVNSDSVKNCFTCKPVFLSTSILKEIFMSLPPSSSASLPPTNNFEC